MSYIKDIRTVLNEHILINPTQGRYIIREDNKTSRLKEVVIEGLNHENTVVFKPDKYYPILPHVNTTIKDISKASDAVIFTNINEQIYIFICELKSGNFKRKEIEAKFLNTTYLVEHLQKLCKQHINPKIKMKDANKFNYILFHSKRKKANIGKTTFEDFTINIYYGQYNKVISKKSTNTYQNIPIVYEISKKSARSFIVNINDIISAR